MTNSIKEYGCEICRVPHVTCKRVRTIKKSRHGLMKVVELLVCAECACKIDIYVDGDGVVRVNNVDVHPPLCDAIRDGGE